MEKETKPMLTIIAEHESGYYIARWNTGITELYEVGKRQHRNPFTGMRTKNSILCGIKSYDTEIKARRYYTRLLNKINKK